MGGSREDVRLSKFLSRVLRHAPESAGLKLDREGWVDTSQLLAGARRNGVELDRDRLHHIVATNDKQRFTLSDDGRRIRAAQGHSTRTVAIDYPAADPPDLLFHGTARANLPSILATGLEPRKRHHVHLSPDEETAVRVGRRHGEPAVLRVDAGVMHAAGFSFHRADNGVWLTALVPPRYLQPLD